MLAAVIMSIAAHSKRRWLAKGTYTVERIWECKPSGELLALNGLDYWPDIPHASVTGLTAASPSRMF